MSRALVNPRMTARLVGSFFPNSVTVQVAAEVRDSTGEPQPTWTDVAGLKGLPCRITAYAGVRHAQETNLAYAIVTDITHIIVLVGDYSGLVTTKHRLKDAVGTLYDIRLVVVDATNSITRMQARIVTI
jgi:SPP1 family predicted phage head-tail adaptor